MKIDNSISSISSLAGADGASAKPGAKTAGKADSGIVLAGSAAQLQALKPDAMSVDHTRVEEIKQAIASGSITINPANIADGLLDSVVQMLGKGKP